MSEAADRIVRDLLADPQFNGEYRSLDGDNDLGGIELIPDILYGYPLTDRFYRDVTLTVYLGIGSLGGALWDHEVRSLERLSGMEHPGLPQFLDGGTRPGQNGPSSGAAYIRTTAFQPAESENSTQHRLASSFAEDRTAIVPHLWMLADALAIMHDAGIHHRNLWSGSLSVDEVDDDEPIASWKIRLARFEMSAMFANLLRTERVGAKSGDGREALRSYFLDNLPPRSRVFAAPERLRFMFGVESETLGHAAADVYGLGMIAVEWLLGAEALEGPVDSLQDVFDLQEAIRKRLRVTTEIPASLSGLLHEMLDPQPDGRLTAYEVSERLGRAYDSATVELGGVDTSTLPFLVAYVRGESDKTLLTWGHVKDSSLTEEGEEQLQELIRADMKGAVVVQSARGARGYVKVGAADKLDGAKTVIIGRELVWFAQEFLRDGERFDQVAIVLFVLERERAQKQVAELLRGSLRRTVFAVEPIPNRIGSATLRSMVRTRPSWKKLVSSLRVGRQLPTALHERIETFQWHIGYQQALLTSREYPFTLEQGSSRSLPELRWDREADHDRGIAASDPVTRFLVLDPQRASMADFFAGAAGEDEKGVAIDVISEDRSTARGPTQRYYLHSTRGSDTVVLSDTGSRLLPARGRIRLAEDSFTVPQLQHQSAALAELADRTDLLRQLVKPTGRPMRRDDWHEGDISLSGEGRAAVLDLLTHPHLFALQGPPGTGKTEVTSEAVAHYLRRERGARVLVSAQSHDALDNLAERILRKLNMIGPTAASNDFLALRVTGSERAAMRVSDALDDFQESAAAARLGRVVKERVTSWLAHRRRERPGIAPVLTRWLESVDLLHLDLQSRVLRSANVVFATTGASTKGILVERGTQEPFDWVVVEEAGRAWPTELVLPLVRGSRWTLVGDHAQIGPFARTDVERFIDRLGTHTDPEISSIAEQKATLIAGFDTFGGMFEGDEPHAPRLALSEQYRMHSHISRVVSDTFYGGRLDAKRADQAHSVERPSWLKARSLVWLDTEDMQGSEGFWTNEFEANLISRIVRDLRPQPGRAERDLAILTPYRAQVRALIQVLSERSPQIHTIDGFQGREAEIVVASLVRDRVANEGIAAANVGHLVHSGRTNVLLSRARDLLIVVGRIHVYEHFAGESWAQAVKVFRDHDRVVPLSSVVDR